MYEEQLFYFFYKMYFEFYTVRTDVVGCMHYISTVHLCDVLHMLYGNKTNLF